MRLEWVRSLALRVGKLSPDKSGGPNGSMQHQLEVYLQQSRQLKSFAFHLLKSQDNAKRR